MKKNIYLLIFVGALFLSSCEKLNIDKWNLDKKEYHDFISFNKTIIDSPEYMVCGICTCSDGYIVLTAKSNDYTNDYYIYRLDIYGAIVSNRFLGNYPDCSLYKLDASDTFYLLGSGIGPYDNKVIYFTKMDANLNQVWMQIYTMKNFGDFIANSVLKEMTGSIWMSGAQIDTCNRKNPLVIKINPNNGKGAYNFDSLSGMGTNGNDYANDIVISADNNKYLIITEELASKETYLAKIDSNPLQIVSKNLIPGFDNYEVRCIATADNNFIIYAAKEGSLGGLARKIDKTGHAIWQHDLVLSGSTDDNGSYTIIETSDGSIAALSSSLLLTVWDKNGNTKMKIDFSGFVQGNNFLCEPTEKGFVFASSDGSRVYIIKTLPDGTIKTE